MAVFVELAARQQHALAGHEEEEAVPANFGATMVQLGDNAEATASCEERGTVQPVAADARTASVVRAADLWGRGGADGNMSVDRKMPGRNVAALVHYFCINRAHYCESNSTIRLTFCSKVASCSNSFIKHNRNCPIRSDNSFSIESI